jgi:hypothetical protein
MPHLRRLTALMPSSIACYIPLLTSLEFIDRIDFCKPFADEAAALAFLRLFGESKIGGNLTVYIISRK